MSEQENPKPGEKPEGEGPKTREHPKAGMDKDGYIWLRIHVSHGILFIVGFIKEIFEPWLREHFKNIEKQEKRSGIVNPFAKGANPFKKLF